jgi:hypothetical protein
VAAQHERLVMEIFGMRGEAPAFLEQYYRQNPLSLLRHQPITENFPSYLVGQYIYRLETQRWFSFTPMPETQTVASGSLDEQVTLDPATGELRMQLRSSGASPLAALAIQQGSALRAVEAYAAGRFPGTLLLAAEPIAIEGTGEAGWSVRIGARSQLLPQADTWVLAPEVLFGEPFLSGWSAGPGPCFRSEASLDLARSIRLPLPLGWEDTAPIPAFQFDWGPLSYRAEVQSAQGAVTLTRRLRVEACNLTGDDLRAVHEVARRISDYERVPLSLARAGATVRP